MVKSGGAEPAPFPPEKVWILGAGRFGRLAAERLKRRLPGADFLVVDDREEKLAALRDDLKVPVIAHDAISHLAEAELADDVWIIPAAPIHVAYLWIMRELEKRGRVRRLPVPSTVDGQVPNPLRAKETVYASYATFICPDACSEPDEICTHTGLPRVGSLFETIGAIQVPGFKVIVVRSWQLAPGVGGYPGGQLKSVLAEIAASPGEYLIATSCRCHGVIDCLGWERIPLT